MRTANTTAPVLVLISVLLAAGCVTLHGPEEIRRDLSDEVGVKLDHEFSITVNRGGMWMARTGMKWAGEEEVDLRGVHHVDVGIYRVEGLRRASRRRARSTPTSSRAGMRWPACRRRARTSWS